MMSLFLCVCKQAPSVRDIVILSIEARGEVGLSSEAAGEGEIVEVDLMSELPSYLVRSTSTGKTHWFQEKVR
jgi:hypothetical protein